MNTTIQYYIDNWYRTYGTYVHFFLNLILYLYDWLICIEVVEL